MLVRLCAVMGQCCDSEDVCVCVCVCVCVRERERKREVLFEYQGPPA